MEVAAFVLSWWDDFNKSTQWQDGIFYALCIADAPRLLRRSDLNQFKSSRLDDIDKREVVTLDVMTKYFIGNMLSGGGRVPAPKASAETWVNLVNGIQKGALFGIPMIYGIDAVHGHDNVYNATIMLDWEPPDKSSTLAK